MSADAQPEQTSPSTTPTGETLHRHLSFWNSLTLGFAMVSPVVGLYAIMGMQTAVTGGGGSSRSLSISSCSFCWQLLAVPLVLGSVPKLTMLYVLFAKVGGTASPESAP